jgi:hypothetical protein
VKRSSLLGMFVVGLGLALPAKAQFVSIYDISIGGLGYSGYLAFKAEGIKKNVAQVIEAERVRLQGEIQQLEAKAAQLEADAVRADNKVKVKNSVILYAAV